MKAITLTEPWASLVAIEAKRIETRSWATSYRGPLAIHAGLGLGPVGGKRAFNDLIASEPFRSALLAGMPGGMRFSCGRIVAVVDLVDCRSTAGPRGEYGTGPKYADWVHDLSAQERAFGNYSPGRFGWLLANVRPLSVRPLVRGQLGLWEVPAEVAAAIGAQLVVVGG